MDSDELKTDHIENFIPSHCCKIPEWFTERVGDLRGETNENLVNQVISYLKTECTSKPSKDELYKNLYLLRWLFTIQGFGCCFNKRIKKEEGLIRYFTKSK